MREIKFRGKRVDNNQWVIGFYSVFTYEKFGGDHPRDDIGCFIFEIKEGNEQTENDTYYRVHQESVGEFIGLKDKHGKDVYENDIIEVDWLDARYKVTRHLVEWSETDCSFLFPGGSPYNDAANYFTVIGNKFDNPELLKQVV